MHQEDRIEKFTFEYATFENIPQKMKEIIEKSEEIQSTLKKDKQDIRQGKYEQNKWPQIIQYMSKCHAISISLYSNNRVQIISQIQHVQFINLKWLNLTCNKISNIQSLCFINFNGLQTLYLFQNKISQIKFLKKLSAPFLSQSFQIYSNPLNQISALIKSQINSKCLYRLSLQYLSKQKPLHQDLSCLIKISSESLKKVYISSKKRIQQVKVQSMLESRFPGLQFKK